jgi:uncharacterized protein (TIGR00730 family)
MDEKALARRKQEIMDHSSYLKAYKDIEFINRVELRPLRLELELLKPQIMLAEQGIEETIVVFGGTQIINSKEATASLETLTAKLKEQPDDKSLQRAVYVAEKKVAKSKYYDECREFSRMISEKANNEKDCCYHIVTGGGPGIMEAANRGADDAGRKSIGLNITLPFEQEPNAYITPGLCFNFHYFALRKMHFLFPAKALICFPGGFGTLDELFTALTLRQTGRMQSIPIILYGTEYWKNIINFDFLADEGVISDDHLELISFTDSPQQTLDLIVEYHKSAS